MSSGSRGGDHVGHASNLEDLLRRCTAGHSPDLLRMTQTPVAGRESRKARLISSHLRRLTRECVSKRSGAFRRIKKVLNGMTGLVKMP